VAAILALLASTDPNQKVYHMNQSRESGPA